MDTRNSKQQKPYPSCEPYPKTPNFTLKILKAKEGNQIFSPINIAHAFGLLLYGACGKTKKEIVNIFGYGELKPLNQCHPKTIISRESTPCRVVLDTGAFFLFHTSSAVRTDSTAKMRFPS